MKRKLKIYLNAPITLGFVSICIIAYLLAVITDGRANIIFFSTYHSSLFDPFTSIRLITHIFGHSSLEHLLSNMIYILLLGPILEEKYHDKLIFIIFLTALITGIFHNIFYPNVYLLGASGVVFAFILLASITGEGDGIPLTLIIAALMWLGTEFYNGIFIEDNISQLTHIIGGVSGLILGLYFKK